MGLRIDDVIQYRSDRLFHGAVNLDWFLSDPAKRSAAATGFVFHGPTYHGVVQGDVGVEHGHALLDTATFTRDVVRRCCGQDDEPFSLAIAGYGTGKSHLALTLASLLSNPGHPIAQEVLRNLQAVDPDIGGEVKALLHEQSKPCLLIALNGMGNFDLTSEITRQISLQVRAHPDGLDVSPLERLRPRFSHATSLVRMASEAVLGELTEACSIANSQGVLDRLEQQDPTLDLARAPKC